MVYPPERGLMVVINSCKICNIYFKLIARATKSKVTPSSITTIKGNSQVALSKIPMRASKYNCTDFSPNGLTV